MPRPLRIEFSGAFYHVFSRGNDKRDIFLSDEDRELFLAALSETCRRFDVLIHSYCLMSNHFHFLLETKKPNLSKFMKYLLGIYTLRFNRTHKRVGHLFQGRYKAYLVDQDSYLLELSRYIHLNPVKAGMTDLPESYPWSSLKLYLSQAKEPHYLFKSLILGQFKSKEAYLQFVKDGIDREIPLEIKKPLGGMFVASKDFVDTFRSKLEEEKSDFKRRECLEIPLDILQEILEFEQTDLYAYILWEIGRRSQREIAHLTSRTQSAVSHNITRFKTRLNQDGKLKSKVRDIVSKISYFMDWSSPALVDTSKRV